MKRIMKKEGDADVIFLGKAPYITSKKVGTTQEYRKEAKQFLIDNFLNKHIANAHTGYKIFFTSRSIDKLLYKAGDSKLRALFHIKEIIETATPTNVDEIKRDNNPIKSESDFVYNMESIIMIDGKWYEYGFKTFVKLNESKDNVSQVSIYSGHLDIKSPLN